MAVFLRSCAPKPPVAALECAVGHRTWSSRSKTKSSGCSPSIALTAPSNHCRGLARCSASTNVHPPSSGTVSATIPIGVGGGAEACSGDARWCSTSHCQTHFEKWFSRRCSSTSRPLSCSISSGCPCRSCISAATYLPDIPSVLELALRPFLDEPRQALRLAIRRNPLCGRDTLREKSNVRHAARNAAGPRRESGAGPWTPRRAGGGPSLGGVGGAPTRRSRLVHWPARPGAQSSPALRRSRGSYSTEFGRRGAPDLRPRGAA